MNHLLYIEYPYIYKKRNSDDTNTIISVSYLQPTIMGEKNFVTELEPDEPIIKSLNFYTWRALKKSFVTSWTATYISCNVERFHFELRNHD